MEISNPVLDRDLELERERGVLELQGLFKNLCLASDTEQCRK
jgi:hypothetical protein